MARPSLYEKDILGTRIIDTEAQRELDVLSMAT